MVNDVFYSNIPEIENVSNLFKGLKEHSNSNSATIYIIDEPMGFDSHDSYSYKQAAVFLMPKHKLVFINYGDANSKDFDNFCEDFEEDLRVLSSKHKYITILGRKREWEHLIVSCNVDDTPRYEDFLEKHKIADASGDAAKDDCRKIELLISLLIGSINDAETIGKGVPETRLDMVNRKVKLFDGMQSRFVYEEVEKKRVIIQGLAGTGKTELLLHKIQKTYIREKDAIIAFTCFNKVLGSDMKLNRIPRFFNAMSVDEQIEWNKRLFAFHSWGSFSEPNSGLYSLICYHYGLSFKRFSQVPSFSHACSDALEQLKQLNDFEPYFDYIFVDESQDFDECFFELCEYVAKKKVFVAGDIFQNIFDIDVGEGVSADYLLNKCYRTDPKTLMFAHAVGMGLYEEPVLRWLEDDQWRICGYNKSTEHDKAIISRVPLRRFGDDEHGDFYSIDIQCAPISKLTLANYVEQIVRIVREIRNENPSVSPDDIAIVFLSNVNINYDIAPLLRAYVDSEFRWKINEGYETKAQRKGQLLLTNTNNVKGLEFPFIICLATGSIGPSIRRRNSIYMILTRSFLKSYFVVREEDSDFFNIYSKAAEYINKNCQMLLREPDSNEKEKALEQIRISTSTPRKSVEEIVEEILLDYPQIADKKRRICDLLADDSPGDMKEIEERVRAIIDALGGKRNV